jgi:hypothetical protein
VPTGADTSRKRGFGGAAGLGTASVRAGVLTGDAGASLGLGAAGGAGDADLTGSAAEEVAVLGVSAEAASTTGTAVWAVVVMAF